MATPRFCMECGGLLKENAKFCPFCGTAVKPVEEKPREQEQQPAAQQPQSQEAAHPLQQQSNQPIIAENLDATIAQPRPIIRQQTKQPPPQPQYGQPSAQKKKPPIVLFIALFFVVFAAVIAVAVFVIFNAVSGSLKSTASADFFEIGGDKIPSVKYILGEERNVAGVSTSVSDGIEEKVISYGASENQGDEMYVYATALMNSYGYYNITAYDFSGSAGSDFQFAAKSSEDGYLIIIHIDYDANGYTLKIQRGKGELTF